MSWSYSKGDVFKKIESVNLVFRAEHRRQNTCCLKAFKRCPCMRFRRDLLKFQSLALACIQETIKYPYNKACFPTSLLFRAELLFSSLTSPVLPKRQNKAKASPTKSQNTIIEGNKWCRIEYAGQRSNGSPLPLVSLVCAWDCQQFCGVPPTTCHENSLGYFIVVQKKHSWFKSRFTHWWKCPPTPWLPCLTRITIQKLRTFPRDRATDNKDGVGSLLHAQGWCTLPCSWHIRKCCPTLKWNHIS